jgi:hypothetical protein
MRRRVSTLSVLALAVFLVTSGFASAQAPSAQPQAGAALDSPIGKIVALEGSATVERSAVVATLASASGPVGIKVNDLVYTGDILQTAAASKLGVVFADGTALNMLASARMELNEFVYQPDGKWNSSMFNAVKGTFTFIGGKMAKAGNLRVNTTAATLGIRGTTAHIVINEDGTVRFSTLVEERH